MLPVGCRGPEASDLIMGEVQSKLGDSNAVTGLSYLEDGQFAKIYKVTSKLKLKSESNIFAYSSHRAFLLRALFISEMCYETNFNGQTL